MFSLEIPTLLLQSVLENARDIAILALSVVLLISVLAIVLMFFKLYSRINGLAKKADWTMSKGQQISNAARFAMTFMERFRDGQKRDDE